MNLCTLLFDTPEKTKDKIYDRVTFQNPSIVIPLGQCIYLCSLVTSGNVIWFGGGIGAFGMPAVASRGSSAVVLALALDVFGARREAAIVVAARSFGWRAPCMGLSLAPFFFVLLRRHAGRLPGVTTRFGALGLVVSTVAFLSFLYDLVPAEGAVTGLEAICFSAVRDGVEHGRDVVLGAVGEFVVVVPVATSGGGEHNVVSRFTTWTALLRIVMW